MPYFRVILHGTGVRCSVVPGNAPVTGFFVGRAVRAASAEEAVIKAKQMVAAIWKTDEYVQANEGDLPTLTTDSVSKISWLAARRIVNQGHTFYRGEE